MPRSTNHQKGEPPRRKRPNNSITTSAKVLLLSLCLFTAANSFFLKKWEKPKQLFELLASQQKEQGEDSGLQMVFPGIYNYKIFDSFFDDGSEHPSGGNGGGGGGHDNGGGGDDKKSSSDDDKKSSSDDDKKSSSDDKKSSSDDDKKSGSDDKKSSSDDDKKSGSDDKKSGLTLSMTSKTPTPTQRTPTKKILQNGKTPLKPARQGPTLYFGDFEPPGGLEMVNAILHVDYHRGTEGILYDKPVLQIEVIPFVQFTLFSKFFSIKTTKLDVDTVRPSPPDNYLIPVPAIFNSTDDSNQTFLDYSFVSKADIRSADNLETVFKNFTLSGPLGKEGMFYQAPTFSTIYPIDSDNPDANRQGPYFDKFAHIGGIAGGIVAIVQIIAVTKMHHKAHRTEFFVASYAAMVFCDLTIIYIVRFYLFKYYIFPPSFYNIGVFEFAGKAAVEVLCVIVFYCTQTRRNRRDSDLVDDTPKDINLGFFMIIAMAFLLVVGFFATMLVFPQFFAYLMVLLPLVLLVENWFLRDRLAYFVLNLCILYEATFIFMLYYLSDNQFGRTVHSSILDWIFIFLFYAVFVYCYSKGRKFKNEAEPRPTEEVGGWDDAGISDDVIEDSPQDSSITGEGDYSLLDE